MKDKVLIGLIGILVVIIILHSSGTAAYEQEAIIAHHTDSPVELDGLSNEAAWEGIEPLPVVMQVPRFGTEPSERTDILLAYDEENLYIAGRFYDSQPSAIHATTMKRDDSEESSDSFGIIIDTFNDNENALGFITTPTGSRWDLTVTGDAQLDNGSNSSWNTFWEVETVRNADGWFTEMRIPFSSLRFQDRGGRVVMSFIVYRWIARKDERVIFPAIPRNWGTLSHMKPSQAQDIIFEGIHSRRPLYLTPYILGGIGQSYMLNDAGTEYKRDDEPVREVGVDAKYGLTSNLTLDGTSQHAVREARGSALGKLWRAPFTPTGIQPFFLCWRYCCLQSGHRWKLQYGLRPGQRFPCFW